MNHNFFQQNRDRLRQLASSWPIVIGANGLLQRNADNVFPFRQDSNFYYLTGINQPDLVLVMDKSSDYLIVPSRSTSREHFDGALDLADLKSTSGVEDILDTRAGWSRLEASLKKSRQVATLTASPSYIASYGLFVNPARGRLIRKLKRAQSGLEIVDMRELLASLRVLKQPEELELIQKAIDITTVGLEKARQSLPSYRYEYELEASLTASFRTGGASGHAFAPIVASGKNACTLHNVSNNSPLNLGDLVTLDVGAEVENYAADITRTLAIGRPSARQKQVYEAVLATQNYALGLLKPGTDIIEYEGKIVDFIGRQLIELGVIRKNTPANVRNYYPHSTGHFMGLDVHDVGDYRQPLVENMVLTCEPGIYIPEEGIGVRIEDDVLITNTGNVVLSRGSSRKL